MQNELTKGDKVVTIGGLHGIVDAVDEGKVVIKCGDGSRLTYDRNAIREVVELRKLKANYIKTGGGKYTSCFFLWDKKSF